MGILDEAIREHLELKRQRGATESELKRLEDEAFGPPSRPGEPDFPEHGEPSPEQAGNGTATEVVPPAPPGLAAGEAEPTATPEPEAEAEPALPIEGRPEDEETTVYEPSAEAEAEEPAVPPEAPIETLETVEHPFPEEEGAEEGHEEEPEPPQEGEGEDDEEDVLADTPEFLKDAPEDDELWFEQGEPKDFDF